MAAVPGLEAQTTFAHLRRGCSPHLYVGQARRRLFEGMGRGDSEEGEPQGAGDAPLVYSVGTLPELRACKTPYTLKTTRVPPKPHQRFHRQLPTDAAVRPPPAPARCHVAAAATAATAASKRPRLRCGL